MNLEKLKVKALMAESMGREIEKDVERAQLKVYKLQGGQEALSAAVKIVSDLIVPVKEKILKGELVLDPKDEMALAKFIVGQMQGVVRTIHDMAEKMQTESVRADGARAAYEESAKRCKSIFDEEVKKLENLEKQIQAGTVKFVDGDLMFEGDGPRPPGAHPGLTLKMQRQAEETAETKKGNGVTKKPRRKKAKTEALDDSNS